MHRLALGERYSDLVPVIKATTHPNFSISSIKPGSLIMVVVVHTLDQNIIFSCYFYRNPKKSKYKTKNVLSKRIWTGTGVNKSFINSMTRHVD